MQIGNRSSLSNSMMVVNDNSLDKAQWVPYLAVHAPSAVNCGVAP